MPGAERHTAALAESVLRRGAVSNLRTHVGGSLFELFHTLGPEQVHHLRHDSVHVLHGERSHVLPLEALGHHIFHLRFPARLNPSHCEIMENFLTLIHFIPSWFFLNA